ncbi:MAG: IS200/IS605 family transposase [Bacteroidota bacterium]
MPRSYSRIILHAGFSTKYRQPFIDEEIEAKLYAIMGNELEKYDCVPIAIGGVSDHVHLLFAMTRTATVAKVMQSVKGVSSYWIRRQGKKYEDFKWQCSYFVFSADYRKLDGLIKYILNQKVHHGQNNEKIDFKREYEKLLRAFGFTDFDPKLEFPLPSVDSAA